MSAVEMLHYLFAALALVAILAALYSIVGTLGELEYGGLLGCGLLVVIVAFVIAATHKQGPVWGLFVWVLS